MSLHVRSVEGPVDLLTFIKLPWSIYKDDPHWVPPLLRDRRSVLSKEENPFFLHADVHLMLAERDGVAVGRITAHIDHEYNRFHGENVGAFGFFEAQDCQVAVALLERAQEWLFQRGSQEIRGPMSFSTNSEVGILLEGFDSPPYIMMGHNPQSYGSWIEEAGYTKAKDLYAWHYRVGEVPDHAIRVAEKARNLPGLVLRQINMKSLTDELHMVLHVFNQAWSNNWGFVPFTKEEMAQRAKELKLIIDPRLALIAEVDGDPVAISIVIPNINEAIGDLDGRLFPFGWAKLLWRLRVRRLKSGRLALLGVVPQYRGAKGMGLSVLLYYEMNKRAEQAGYRFGELSWTLEENERINAGIEFMGGERYKVYRIYQKKLV